MISFEKYFWLLIHCQEFFPSQIYLFWVLRAKIILIWFIVFLPLLSRILLLLTQTSLLWFHFFQSLICLDHSIQIKHISIHHIVQHDDCFQTQVWAALVVWDTVYPPPPLLFHRRLQIVHLLGGTIPHICHGRHGQRPCKFFLACVNFYRFNAKNWHFWQILREKVAFFYRFNAKNWRFSV